MTQPLSKKKRYFYLFFWLFLLPLLLAPLASAATSSKTNWDEVLSAGKKEGKVVIAGSPDPVMRAEIMPKFTAQTGIQVELIAGRSSEIVNRLKIERQAETFSIDVFLAGPTTTGNVLYPEKLIDPLKPLMILSEVVDPSKWKKGKLWFVDPEERYVLRGFSHVNLLLHINSDHVRAEDLRSAKDLLNPKWLGKITTDDFMSTGRGAAQAARFYLQFGEDFIKKLYIEQKVVRSRDQRQIVDWLARGTHPICLTCNEGDVKPLQKDGFKIAGIYRLSDVEPGTNAEPWLLSLANRAPHPKAAQVFANWIMSREGLETYSRGYGTATLRNDVDESFLPPESIPRPGAAYFDDSDWNWQTKGQREAREQAWKILKALVK